jgi:hypothetical protein
MIGLQGSSVSSSQSRGVAVWTAVWSINAKFAGADRLVMAEFRTPHCFMPEWPRISLELAVGVLVMVIRLFAEGGNALHCCA